MSGSPLTGPGGAQWWRGPTDVFIPADVDGDGQQEIVIYCFDNVRDVYTGVLKWQGGALQPIWMSDTPLAGPVNWDRKPGDQLLAADVDGDGQQEILIYNNKELTTGLLKWQAGALEPVWKSGTTLIGSGWEWARGDDSFMTADVDGDGQQEIVIYCNPRIGSNDQIGTGVLKWQGGTLGPIWMGGSQLPGLGWDWTRTVSDWFYTADIKGDQHEQTVIYNNFALEIGVLPWLDGALRPIWMSGSQLTTSGGAEWLLGGEDGFAFADLDGDRQQQIVIYSNSTRYTGMIRWQEGALALIWMHHSPLTGPGGFWSIAELDQYPVADLDGDGQGEVVIWALWDPRTGALKWQGGVLQLLWKIDGPLTGPGGEWDRGVGDWLIPADVDGDGQQEILIYNKGDQRTGILKWNLPSPTEPLTMIRFVIATGADDLGGGLHGSSATADVFLNDGSSFTVTLRASSEPNWASGSTHQVDFAVPNAVSPPLTQSNGIVGARINLVQRNPIWSADSWDIANLYVSLFNPGEALVCQLNLIGTATLQDGSIGLIRLSQSAGSGGSGPSSPTYKTGPGSGC